MKGRGAEAKVKERGLKVKGRGAEGEREGG